ncbi:MULTISPECIES: lysylphosphatidylglycerol synthase transmembrane domain-containing protein [unclassified Candidatus Frackibacter]|uniref:lysylphosphatidylglycerol synthase transmembrane domain-containing protein n=1 Tax=unclassified Candidatus Frackibacter TaxID=2648818 RepID=UPI0008848637|nr:MULTISPECIES: lysylphosphatidylglycerol synthase transmembrane domain-containing protein [unclassified Candidatus Frackibacter]SDC77104.1 hypothetical protein SAMN04515661_1248 [Candidatus Frackibacter sp. WG11]SEM90255.1 hypothetical protein SAMN04488698_1248 [Candidatus Frackibacter sp. WG12]SFM00440.1 hypothetical protein SAMN04488699_12537 [Candidatus Frackibacter sp. WG13]
MNLDEILKAGKLLFNPKLLLIFGLGYSLAFWLRSIAWLELFKKRNMETKDLFSLQMVSLLFNHIFPAKMGEVAKIYLLHRRDYSVAKATSTVVYSRVIDIISLIINVMIFSLLSISYISFDWKLLLLPLILITIILIGILIFSRWSLISKIQNKLFDYLLQLQQAFKEISFKQLVKAVLITIPSWILEVSAIMVVVSALGLDLGLIPLVVVNSFTIMTQVFHITPGGVGTYEASMAFILGLYGVDLELALSIAVLTHSLKFIYSYLIGGIFTLRESVKLVDIVRFKEKVIG